MSHERLKHYALTAFAGWATWQLVNSAFSYGVRKKIGRRDKWTCQDDGCDRQWKDGWMLQASHYNHRKDSPFYDTIEQGRIQCVPHHLQFHIDYVGQAHLIGLSEEQNARAVQLLLNTNVMQRGYEEPVLQTNFLSLLE